MQIKEFIAKHQHALILAGMSCFLAGVTVEWLRLDNLPPAWDDALYLAKSLVMFDALTDGGLVGYARRFFTILDWKPPLITALPTPFYLTLGRNPAYAFGVNIVLIPVLLVSVYLLGKRCWNARAGLLAAWITVTMPMVYGLARWYLVEFILTALVCVGVLLLIESRGFCNQKKALAVGTIWGLGSLLKVIFPLYLIGPFLFALATFLLQRGTPTEKEPHPPSRLGILVRLATPALLLALPWYLLNLRRVSQLVLVAGFSPEADIYGTGPVFSQSALKAYLVHLTNAGPSAYYIALAVLLLGWITLSGKLRVFLHRLRREPRVFLVLWALPFLVFLFGRNKNVRFVAPLLPVLALTAAFALDFITEQLPRGRRLFLGLVLAFPVVSMLHTSFGILGDRRVALGNFEFLATNLDYARKFDRAVWSHQEMLQTMYTSARINPHEKTLVMLGTDRAAFNTENLQLASMQARLPFEMVTPAYETDLSRLLVQADTASFFVYKEGGEPEGAAYNIHHDALIRHVRESGRFVEVPYGRVLPDGGVARIFKNLSTRAYIQSGAFLPAALELTPNCSVKFADQIELVGLAVDQTPVKLRVRYRWRCLRPVEREYWCFTHLVEPSGTVVGFLDHELLKGDPSLREWKAGDEAVEDLTLNFPEPRPGEPLRLVLGLFHPPTGERLQVSSFVAPNGMSFILTDQDTAVLVTPNPQVNRTTSPGKTGRR